MEKKPLAITNGKPKEFGTTDTIPVSNIPNLPTSSIINLHGYIASVLTSTQTISFNYNPLLPLITLDVITQMSISSDGSGVKLVNDSATPGNGYYYGTDATGVKGFHTLPVGSTDLSFTGLSSPVTLVSSTGTDVTFVAGTNVTLSATGSALTINAISVPDGNGIYTGSNTIPVNTLATVTPDPEGDGGDFAIGTFPDWPSINFTNPTKGLYFAENLYGEVGLLWGGNGFFAGSSGSAMTGGTQRINLNNLGIRLNFGPYLQTGSGSPEGVVTATPGSLYFNNSGGVNSHYFKQSGSGNTGWVSISAVSPPTTPALPFNSVQWNNAGAFGGNADLTWDNTLKRLDINGVNTVNTAATVDVTSTFSLPMTSTNMYNFNSRITSIADNGFTGQAGIISAYYADVPGTASGFAVSQNQSVSPGYGVHPAIRILQTGASNSATGLRINKSASASGVYIMTSGLGNTLANVINNEMFATSNGTGANYYTTFNSLDQTHMRQVMHDATNRILGVQFLDFRNGFGFTYPIGTANGKVGMGFQITNAVLPNARLDIRGEGSTSATWGLQVHNSTGTNNALMVRDNGRVGFGTNAPTAKFHFVGETNTTSVDALLLTSPDTTSGVFRIRGNNEWQVSTQSGSPTTSYSFTRPPSNAGTVMGLFNGDGAANRALEMTYKPAAVHSSGNLLGGIHISHYYGLSPGEFARDIVIGLQSMAGVANNNGSSIVFYNRNTSTGAEDAARIASALSNVTPGTTTGFLKFDIATNGVYTEQGRFTSTGLGVGTTAPSAKLHVNGTTRFEAYPNSLNSAGSPVNVLTTDASGNLESHTVAEVVSSGGGISGTGASPQIAYWNGASSLTGNAALEYTGGNVSMSSGNIDLTNNATIQFVGRTHANGFVGLNLASGVTVLPSYNIGTYNSSSLMLTGTNNIRNNIGGTIRWDLSASSAVANFTSSIYLGAPNVIVGASSGAIANNPKLSIVNNTTSALNYSIASNNSGTSVYSIRTDGSALFGYDTPTPPARLSVQGSGSTSATWTAQFHNSTGTNNALMVRNDGAIGVRTNNPTTTNFHIVEAGIASKAGAVIQGTSTQTAYGADYANLTLTNPSGTVSSSARLSFSGATGLNDAVSIGCIFSGTQNGSMVFSTRSGASWGERMRLTESGALVIGATSAAQTLHVAGTMRLTGSDGTATTIMGRDADGDISTVALGEGVAISGGTLTGAAPTIGYIESSTATSIDLDANVGEVKDVDGTNIAFTLPTNVDRFEVYRNGLLLARTGSLTTRGYSLNTGTNTITFTVALTASDVIIIKKT